MDYSIGKYKFDNSEEFQKALKEAAWIEKTRSKYDLTDIEIVKKILILIKQGKISFTTSIGKDFVSELKQTYISANSKAAKTPNNSSENIAPEKKKETKESSLRNEKSPKGVFYYCYLPIVVVAFIIVICLVSSRVFINNQFRNFLFVAEFIVLYIASEIVMSVAGLKYKKYQEEVKKDYILARVHIPKKLFRVTVFIMIVLIAVLFIKPFLKNSPSGQEKIKFRNEVLLSEKID